MNTTTDTAQNWNDATPEEMAQVDKLRELLHPGLRRNRKGRVTTTAGDKTMLGLYRTLAQFVDFTKART
jgi:hypothetical protein